MRNGDSPASAVVRPNPWPGRTRTARSADGNDPRGSVPSATSGRSRSSRCARRRTSSPSTYSLEARGGVGRDDAPLVVVEALGRVTSRCVDEARDLRARAAELRHHARAVVEKALHERRAHLLAHAAVLAVDHVRDRAKADASASALTRIAALGGRLACDVEGRPVLAVGSEHVRQDDLRGGTRGPHVREPVGGVDLPLPGDGGHRRRQRVIAHVTALDPIEAAEEAEGEVDARLQRGVVRRRRRGDRVRRSPVAVADHETGRHVQIEVERAATKRAAFADLEEHRAVDAPLERRRRSLRRVRHDRRPAELRRPATGRDRLARAIADEWHAHHADARAALTGQAASWLLHVDVVANEHGAARVPELLHAEEVVVAGRHRR